MTLRPSTVALAAVLFAGAVRLPIAVAATSTFDASAAWPPIAFDDDFHSGLPGTLPAGQAPQATGTIALTAFERPAASAAIPPVLYAELDAAERLMHKPVAYRSAAALNAYLQSVACARPVGDYDRRGFLASLGLHGLRASGRTDRPTLLAIEQLPNFRPGTLVDGHAIAAQVTMCRFALDHPDAFLGLIALANPVIEAHSLRAALWKKPFEPVQEARPLGLTAVQRYGDALAKLPYLGFDADFATDPLPTLPSGRPGYGTYTIALDLGFTPDQAKRLALNDDDVDYDTTPYGHTSFAPTDQMDRHFNLDPHHQDTRLVWASRHLNAAERYAREGAYDQAEVELGVGLHSLQDLFAHGQLTPCMHGVIGEFPDDVTDDPIAFYEASVATEAYLGAYLRAIAPASPADLPIEAGRSTPDAPAAP